MGGDPRRVLEPEVVAAPLVVTFGTFAEEYIASVEAGWKSDVHRQQWRQSLRDHAAAIREMPIAQVGTDDLLSVLRPIWTSKSETAKRLKSPFKPG